LGTTVRGTSGTVRVERLDGTVAGFVRAGEHLDVKPTLVQADVLPTTVEPVVAVIAVPKNPSRAELLD